MAKTLTGIVTSDLRDKTITITVTSRETHPIYKKQYSVKRKYQAHDENNEASMGDKVTISAIRPVSKTKAFTLAKIEEKSKGSLEIKEVKEVVMEKETPQTDAATAKAEEK
jgi:small subunit ribosomal protein S17